MPKLAQCLVVPTIFGIVGHVLTSQPSLAVTAEVAKACRAMAIKAHPTPLAGTKASGAEKAQRDFFEECITKGSVDKDKSNENKIDK